MQLKSLLSFFKLSLGELLCKDPNNRLGNINGI